ncbi:Uncharacterised protein [Mycobacteroides abscessus subsp. abscessus]|nr:Uncharacterised protein [Mycobacteroides abscessus subsp. abscessus]
MHLCQCAGTGPDLVGDRLVVDLLAECDELVDAAPLDERERLLPARCHIVGVLAAGEPEFRLGPDELKHVRILKVIALRQAAAEMHQR